MWYIHTYYVIAVGLKLTWTVCAQNEAKEKALLYFLMFSLKFLASLLVPVKRSFSGCG